MTGLAAIARRAASKCVMPLVLRAAKAYVAGACLDEAMIAVARVEPEGYGTTLGYWDRRSDTPRSIADEYRAGIDVMSGHPRRYLSIKLPSLGVRDEIVDEVIGHALDRGVRVHFDALGQQFVERTQRAIERNLARGAALGYTIPGRWARSPRDAHWAIERGLSVRVVKGQWPDLRSPESDLRAGFLDVVDCLAKGAPHVALASHDVPLVEEAVARLRAAGVPCSLELLRGLPTRESLRSARALGLDVTMYVPYGQEYLPYALSKLFSEPRTTLWFARDLLTRP